MRSHQITALLLAGPFALAAAGLAAQDTTQAQTQGQQRDSSYQQYPQANTNTQSQDQVQLSDEQVVMRIHRTNQMEIRVARLAQSRASSARVKSFASRLIRDHTANDKKVVALAKQLNITLGRDGMDSTGNQWARDQHRDRWNKPDSTQRNDSTYSAYPRSDTTQQSDTSRRYGERFDSTQGQSAQGRYGEDQDSTHRDMAAMRQLQTLRGAAFDTAFANAMVNGHTKAIGMLEQVQNQVQRQEVRTLIASTLPTIRQHLQIAQSLTTSATTTSSR
jgi:predicted outer membrane protein